MTTNRPLRVFLCHSSNDKPVVRELYKQLRAEPWLQPWLDEEELYPGQDWNLEIEKAVEVADAILVCLTKGSITKEGYVQRELRIVLDVADYKPEGTLFIIPVRLEECEPPRRLRVWQYADYFEGQRERAFQRLLVSLKRRADGLGLIFEMSEPKMEEELDVEKQVVEETSIPAPFATPLNKLTLGNGMEFMYVPRGKFLMGSTPENKQAYDDEKPQHIVDIPYDYWMARFPVTNEFYNAYVKFKKINHPVADWETKKDHPVTYIKWADAIQYCQWLNDIFNWELSSSLVLRLPTEAEWEKTARWLPFYHERGMSEGSNDGKSLEYPWGDTFDKNKCNTSESGRGSTTPVGFYASLSYSPYGCADLAGNVWEWTHSLKKPYPYKVNDGREDKKAFGARVLRGGSFDGNGMGARCACRGDNAAFDFDNLFGFRVVVAPKLP